MLAEDIFPLVKSRRASSKAGCAGCNTGKALGFDFEYAFQPIVDLKNRTIFAHEALVRGPNGESAPSVLSKVDDANRYQFDQACRAKAVASASPAGHDDIIVDQLPAERRVQPGSMHTKHAERGT